MLWNNQPIDPTAPSITFPKDPKPAQIFFITRKEFFMFDGSIWTVVGGNNVSREFRNQLIDYISKYDPFDPISLLKTDLDMLFPERDFWEENLIKRVIEITKDIQKVKLHI